MKKALIINTAILLCCLPLSGIVAWLALHEGIGPHYAGFSTFDMIVHHVFSPVKSGLISVRHPAQSAILLGPPTLFLSIMTVSLIKNRRKTSYIFSTLASLYWVVIVILAIWARALP
jgi:hypothetical protein